MTSARTPPRNPSGGPSWLGIGAQRSGTTWFTGLLLQHPSVGLGTNDKKEQHLLHRVADGLTPAEDYTSLFPADDLLRGEWTPQYLRQPSTATAAANLLPGVPVFVLLRDPLERYRSAMRLSAGRKRSYPYPVQPILQTWSGFYADQLDGWASKIGRERMHVGLYEDAAADPQTAVNAAWRQMGLDPVPLSSTEQRSSSTSKADWEWPEGLEETLRGMYLPQLPRLEADWGLDLSRWSITDR